MTGSDDTRETERATLELDAKAVRGLQAFGTPRDVSASSLRASLVACLERVGDGSDADLRAPAHLWSGDRRKSPSGILAVMRWLADGFDRASTDDWLAAGTLLDHCPDGTCFADDEEGAAYDEAVRLARALILTRSDQRGELAARRQLAARTLDPAGYRGRIHVARMVRPAAPALARAGLGQWAKGVSAGPAALPRASEFDNAGKAFTEGEVRGRVLLHIDAITRAVRPAIGDAAIRLLARNGYDVDVPSAASDCGIVADQLGLPDLAKEQIRENCQAWGKAVLRAWDDGRPKPIGGLVTLSPLTARLISRYTGRVLDHDDKLLSPILDGACDIVDWLARNEMAPPPRWSAFRTGLVGDAESPEDGGARTARAIDVLGAAGFGVRCVGDGPALGRAVGILPWVSPDLNADLRTYYARAMSGAPIDLLAIEEAATVSIVEDLTDRPVVHIVELLDWVHGGPIPEGCEHLEAHMHELPMPSDGPATDPVVAAERGG